MLNIGVIGTGAIGQDHMKRITEKLKGAQITAVTDVNQAVAKEVIDKFQIKADIYKNGHDVIKAKEVDALIVTSWGPTHEEFVLASITEGKPVFCEKPLAVTAEGCRKIVEAEMAYGKKLVQVGFMRRFDTGYRKLKKVVEEDRVGTPLMVHCAHRAPSMKGFTGDMAITDSFVHEIDVLRWILKDDFISAQVVLPKTSSKAEKDLQDPHFILLETTKGVRVDTEIFVNCQYGYDIQCQVVGETGTANLPEPASILMRSEAKLSTEILTDWKDRFIDSYDVEIQEWINGVLSGEMNGPSAWDGYLVAVTVDACVKAKHTKEIVAIEKLPTPEFYSSTHQRTVPQQLNL